MDLHVRKISEARLCNTSMIQNLYSKKGSYIRVCSGGVIWPLPTSHCLNIPIQLNSSFIHSFSSNSLFENGCIDLCTLFSVRVISWKMLKKTFLYSKKS